jgi:dUTPase
MIKVCLTDNAVKVLQHHSISVGDYLRSNGNGLDLYNVGNDMMIQSRTKWLESGEMPVIVPLGLRLDLPPGFVGLIVEKPGIIRTGLMVRDSVVFPGRTEEMMVNLVNVGERDVQISAGSKLPLQLLIVPCYNSFQQVLYQDFIGNSNDNK